MSAVLLVDDDAQVRGAGKQTLELAGHQVTCCDGGEQALKWVRRGYSALITDLRMPGMDGLTLMERTREIDPDLPVIILTGHGDVSTAVLAMRRGAYDFIEKPYPADILVETVRRAVERHDLVMENRRLREALSDTDGGAIIGRSSSVERMRAIIATVAATDADVLVMGETGTGKEMVARALHRQSPRQTKPFVALNCGAMPETIAESELFGHEAGSFTGAVKRRTGRIHFADHGTLFLDEIESMPMSLQVKLLRVLQERVVEPLGSNDLVPVDLRVVAATKADLMVAARENRFREDLYYRLNVVMIRIPPLRERREDIPLLFQHFVIDASERHRREPLVPTPDLMRRLTAHDWPGNVRELRNAADRFVLGLEDVTPSNEAGSQAAGGRVALTDEVDQFEKSRIEAELARHHGSVKATIEALGIPRKTFYDKLRRHGISADDFR